MEQKSYLSVPFEIKKEQITVDDEYFYFEGYASTFNNIDYGQDVVMQGAFTETLKSKRPEDIKLLYQHNSTDILGVNKAFRQDDHGLFAKGMMPREHSKAKDVILLMKCGALNSMSIGYVPVKFEYDDSGIRLLKELDLHEYSIVTFPMNPAATITGMKSLSFNMELKIAAKNYVWNKEDALARVKDYRFRHTLSEIEYQKYFLYADRSTSDYKYLFVDIIDNVPHIVPEGLEEAVNEFKQAQDLKLTVQQKLIIKDAVKRYFKKMGRSDPFNQFFNVKDIDNIKSKREFEQCLRESGLFSIQAAVKLASFCKFPSESDYKKIDAQYKELKTLIEKIL